MTFATPHIERAKASTPREGFIPNPKLKPFDQVSEVMRFKHYSTGFKLLDQVSTQMREDAEAQSKMDLRRIKCPPFPSIAARFRRLQMPLRPCRCPEEA